MVGNLLLFWSVWAVACCAHAHTGRRWSMSSDLIGLVADHFVAPAASLKDSSNTWQQQFRIHRELHGTGFHRKLSFNIHCMSGTASSLQDCQTSLLQPLPSSIYADPYQLEDLVRSSSSSLAGEASNTGGTASFTFQLFGPLDLELPAPACKANALLLSFNMTQQQQQQDKQEEQQLEVQLSVPLHAKYPEPHAFGFQGWQVLSSGHVHVVVPQPWLLLDCRQAGGWLHVLRPPPEQQQQQQEQEQQQQTTTTTHTAGSQELQQRQQQQQQQEVLLWSVPTGNLDHMQLVSWGTLLIAAACCAVLSVRALQVTAAV